MNIKNKTQRLDRFYGDVAKSQNLTIASMITGNSVLEIGCGYGAFVNYMKQEYPSKTIAGIDLDEDSIKIAKDKYGIEVKPMSAYKMDFPGSSFETVVLRDTIHHFESSENLRQALREICRVSSRELIVFDPNPNWIVKFSRFLIRHKDPEAPPGKIKKELEKAGYEITNFVWRDVVAFPLSGGFVGIEMIPNVAFIKKCVLAFDAALNKILQALGIQRFFCWRYLLRAVKTGEKKESIGHE